MGSCQVYLKHAMDTLREASTHTMLTSAGGIDWQAIDGNIRPTLYTLDTAKRIVEGHYTTVFHRFSGDSLTAENISRAIRVIRYMWDKKVKRENAIPRRNTIAVLPTVQSSIPPWTDGSQMTTDEPKD